MKNKILIGIVVLVLCVVGGLALFSTKTQEDDPKKIITSIIDAPKYTVDVTYTTKNSRGEFTEQGKIDYDKKKGAKLTLQDKEQLFTKDSIEINYFEGNRHYKVDRSYDEFYRFFLIHELPRYLNGEDVEKKLDDETKEKLTLIFKTGSDNQNFSKIHFTVNIKTKQPESLIIYDINEKERVVVSYNNLILNKK